MTLDRIYAGLDHAVAVTDEGGVLTWGRNDRGQLGLGDTNDRNTPQLVTLDAASGAVVSACAGQFHTLLLTAAGTVLAMGGNAHGQLGTGTVQNTTTTVPTRVAALAGVEITAVACGTAHSLALAKSGDVYAWGAANAGQLGLGLTPCTAAAAAASPADCELQPVPQPTRVSGLPSIKLIAAGGGFAGGAFEPGSPLGGSHSLFVSASNEVWAVGDNFYGSLGVRHAYTAVTPYTMAALAYDFDGSGGNATLGDAVAYDGNASGAQLAFTTLAQFTAVTRVRPEAWSSPPLRVTSRVTSPVRVGPLSGGAEIVSIVAGAAHSMALTAGGEVWAWGDNRYGQLGLGYTSWPFEDDLFFQRRNTEQPVLVDRPLRLRAWDYVNSTGDTVTGVSNAVGGGKMVEIHAGPRQSMALTAGGTAWIWGSNTGGGLGTCGCGACAALSAAAGTCAVSTAAAPPPPPATGADGLPLLSPPPPPPSPPPGARDTVTRMATGATCTCTCPGHGNTCRTRTVYDATGANAGVINAGVCVTGDGNGPPICECMSPYVTLNGTITTHDLPMPLDMAGFVFESVAAGGSLFAVSISVCPEDSIGRACANNGTCVSPSDGSSPYCECFSGYAGIACEYQCAAAVPSEVAAVVKVSRGGYKSKFPGGIYDPMTEGNMTGLVCSGHGNCTGAQGCACENNWFGDHCQARPCCACFLHGR